MMAFISQPLVESSRYAEVSDAEKGYDSQALQELVSSRDDKHVIPRGNTDIDWTMYRCRHLVENAFLKIKKYRPAATRYDKLARNYHSVVALAFTFLWLPMWVD